MISIVLYPTKHYISDICALTLGTPVYHIDVHFYNSELKGVGRVEASYNPFPRFSTYFLEIKYVIGQAHR